MKKYSLSLAIIGFAVLSLACGVSSVVQEALPVATSVGQSPSTNIPSSSGTSSSQNLMINGDAEGGLGAPRTQTSSLPATTTAAQSGISVFASPIKFVIPSGLAVSASAETIDMVTDQTSAPWDVAPAHLQLGLKGYPSNSSFHVPQIFAYPAAEYAAANPTAAESMKRLRFILSNPAVPYTNNTLPYVPFFNAGQVFAAQEKVIQFNGGLGFRIVTQYAQDVSPINNGRLFYHFEGLTGDGKYYIVAILPTNLQFLPADNDPNSPVPSGGIPFTANNASGTDFENYFKQVTDLINAVSPDQFNPSLNLLDALIQSISIQ